MVSSDVDKYSSMKLGGEWTSYRAESGQAGRKYLSYGEWCPGAPGFFIKPYIYFFNILV